MHMVACCSLMYEGRVVIDESYIIITSLSFGLAQIDNTFD